MRPKPDSLLFFIMSDKGKPPQDADNPLGGPQWWTSYYGPLSQSTRAGNNQDRYWTCASWIRCSFPKQIKLLQEDMEVRSVKSWNTAFIMMSKRLWPPLHSHCNNPQRVNQNGSLMSRVHTLSCATNKTTDQSLPCRWTCLPLSPELILPLFI